MQKPHIVYYLTDSAFCLVKDSSQNIKQQNRHVQNILSQLSGYQSIAKCSVIFILVIVP